jgi:hypothetical protein
MRGLSFRRLRGILGWSRLARLCGEETVYHVFGLAWVAVPGW